MMTTTTGRRGTDYEVDPCGCVHFQGQIIRCIKHSDQWKQPSNGSCPPHAYPWPGRAGSACVDCGHVKPA
jgi:hypothetical protein